MLKRSARPVLIKNARPARRPRQPPHPRPPLPVARRARAARAVVATPNRPLGPPKTLGDLRPAVDITPPPAPPLPAALYGGRDRRGRVIAPPLPADKGQITPGLIPVPRRHAVAPYDQEVLISPPVEPKIRRARVIIKTPRRALAWPPRPVRVARAAEIRRPAAEPKVTAHVPPQKKAALTLPEPVPAP